jgi:hypothetical protein
MSASAVPERLGASYGEAWPIPTSPRRRATIAAFSIPDVA